MQQMLDQKKDFLQASIPFVAANDQSMVMQRCELILNTPQKSGRHVIWPFACALALVLVSYLYIIQPRTQAPPDAGISFSADNAYLVQHTGGGYDLYVGGKLQGNVTDEDVAVPPFSNLTIQESERGK